MTKSERYSTRTLTSTNDLEDMMDDYKDETNSDINYQISFVKIDLPIEKEVNAYILNLYAYEEIQKDIGHWIVVLTKDTNALVYTCFGLFSKRLLDELTRMGYKNVVFDLTSDQPLNSKSCGFYCMRYIIDKQYRKMEDYLWFVDGKLKTKKINDELKSKLRHNNAIYQKTLN